MEEIRVGTRELKNRLSQYMRRVKAGETVIITEHGKPVGQIIPIPVDLPSRLKLLEQAGVLDWDGQTLAPYQPRAANSSQWLISDLVIENRE